MKSETLSITLALALAIGAATWWFSARARSSSAPPANAEPKPAGTGVVDPNNLFFMTASEANERVRRVFPNGVASEDARAQIGTAPPPPDGSAPDGTQSFVSEILPQAPVGAAKVRAAIAADQGRTIERWVKGKVAGSDVWLHVEDPEGNDASFSRLAVVVDLVDRDKPVDGQRLDREIEWARRLASELNAGVPTTSMSAKDAIAKASAAMAARKKYSDDELEIGVVVAAPRGGRFPGKKVWDAVYSAGFSWGDGDYFHWVPSENTDVSQGIWMGTSTGTSYFLPESLEANDRSGDVEDLEMSFSAARCWEPTKVFDVMSHAAAYLARRLGGTVTNEQGTAFDHQAERLRVVAIEQGLKAQGVTPGSELVPRHRGGD